MANANGDELCAHMRGRQSVGMPIIAPCPLCTGRVDEYQAAVAARDAERNADGQDTRKKLEVSHG